MHSIHWGGNTQYVFYTGADLYGRNPTPSFIAYAPRIFTPFSAKLHTKNKNYLQHTFHIIFWNLIEVQLWDFKHVVSNTTPNTVQNLSFLTFVLFQWLKKCGVLRKSTPADATCKYKKIHILFFGGLSYISFYFAASWIVSMNLRWLTELTSYYP